MSRTKSTQIFLLFLLSLVLMLAPQMVRAQGGGDEAEKSKELKRLEALKAEAEAKQAIAEAKKAELEAKFPKATSSPLEGKTTVKEGSIEETLVGYVSVAGAADKIANSIQQTRLGIKRIAVYNEADVKLLVTYSAAIKRVQAYHQRYRDLTEGENQALKETRRELPPLVCTDTEGAAVVKDLGGAGFGAALGAATSVVGNFTDLLSFLRTDVEITGSKFDMAESVIVSEVFRALRANPATRGIELYYPGEFPPNFDPRNDSPMLNEIEALYKLKDDADDLAAQIESRVTRLKARIDNLDMCINLAKQKINAAKRPAKTTAPENNTAHAPRSRPVMLRRPPTVEAEPQSADDVEQLRADIEHYEREKAQLQSDIETLQRAVRSKANLDAQLELLVKDMVKVDEQTGINPLTVFIQSENLQRLMQDDQNYWLKLKVITAGGNTRVKRNLIVDVFTFGNRVSYNGASTIEYHLYDNKGRSIASDTIVKYIDYIKGKRVEEISDRFDLRSEGTLSDNLDRQKVKERADKSGQR